MKLTTGDVPTLDEALALYESGGWTAYTRDPDRLRRSLANSHVVLTVRDDSGVLLGLARTVSDGESICYVQDILVDPAAQRRGVGRLLLQEILDRYRHCMFVALSADAAETEDARRSHPFYRSLGFVPHPELGLAAFGYRP